MAITIIFANGEEKVFCNIKDFNTDPDTCELKFEDEYGCKITFNKNVIAGWFISENY